jgi:uncharacterized protein (TIGR01777 family)
MNVIISGSSGFIGSAVTAELTHAGHRVGRLIRDANAHQPGTILWNPATGNLDSNELEGADVLIHFAGESVAGGRWTVAKKKRIRESRVQGTRLLSQAIARLTPGPQVFIVASAVGYYGDRGDEQLTEDSSLGSGYLADVCRAWELAASAAREAGIRVVHLRFGMVLSFHGGALPKMLLPFKLGLGGVIGSGRQYVSWITLGDAVRAVQFAMQTPALRGPVNVVAPQPVTNREFTKALGQALHRPTLFPLPAFAARLAFGQMAEEVLLAGARVQPQRLQAAGFQFQQPELAAAFQTILDKAKPQ